MVLEKLGNVLRKTTDKIANAVFLDKKLVDSIVRDLQRALIEADVNVKLVMEITQKIKKEALDERMKGVEKKEHIIKLMHDELVRILGGKKEIHLGKRDVFLFVGLYGAGKCVHGESNVQLSDGDIVEARDLYERYSRKLSEENLEDGKIINLNGENLFVSSFNPKTLKIENKRVTHLWRLEKEDLVEVRLDNGNDYSIKVTPEHPFFVLREGNVIKVRADEVKDSDYIAVPNDVGIGGKSVNLFNNIKDLDLYVYLTLEEAKRCVLSKYETLQEACSKLRFRKNYCKFTRDVKKGKIPIEFVANESVSNLKIKGKNDKKIIDFPLYLTSEFAEFLGYVVGDGHIDNKYVEISSEDIQVIERVVELSKILFNITPAFSNYFSKSNLLSHTFHNYKLH